MAEKTRRVDLYRGMCRRQRDHPGGWGGTTTGSQQPPTSQQRAATSPRYAPSFLRGDAPRSGGDDTPESPRAYPYDVQTIAELVGWTGANG